jgi:hypothetical protein
MNPDPFQTRRDYAHVPVRPEVPGIGGDGTRIRVYITEDDGSGNPVAFYRHNVGPYTVVCNTEPDGSGTEYEVYWHLENGVWFTGQAILIAKHQEPLGTARVWDVDITGDNYWPLCTANGAIVAGAGSVDIPYRSYITGSLTLTFATVTVVGAKDTSFNLSDGTIVGVSFDQTTEQFVIENSACPAVA